MLAGEAAGKERATGANEAKCTKAYADAYLAEAAKPENAAFQMKISSPANWRQGASEKTTGADLISTYVDEQGEHHVYFLQFKVLEIKRNAKKQIYPFLKFNFRSNHVPDPSNPAHTSAKGAKKGEYQADILYHAVKLENATPRARKERHHVHGGYVAVSDHFCALIPLDVLETHGLVGQPNGEGMKKFTKANRSALCSTIILQQSHAMHAVVGREVEGQINLNMDKEYRDKLQDWWEDHDREEDVDGSESDDSAAE
ncbi:hypothetical protein MNV49_004084 [Pseudohyphozyma bogoriensis]|nr:hypothetical protein MNV49_004084 [Pseudohyphozyma bogoriensis]